MSQSVSLAWCAQEFVRGGRPTVERTAFYLGQLVALGVAFVSEHGEISGMAADGTRVHLGHIPGPEGVPPRVLRKEWESLGAYLHNHPTPEHW